MGVGGNLKGKGAGGRRKGKMGGKVMKVDFESGAEKGGVELGSRY